MDFNFNNEILREALERLREDNRDENLIKVASLLVDTKIMIPAKWDKEPEVDEKGQLHFEPDTKVMPMVVTNENGLKLFPFFTSVEEMKKLYGEKGVNCIVLGMVQYMPLLMSAKEEIYGIVIDPKGVDMPFPTDLLMEFAQKVRSNLKPILKSEKEKLLLQDPKGNLQDLEAALISYGFHEPAIQALYLKERLELNHSEDQPENAKANWFIIVDVAERDTGVFQRISDVVRPLAQGRDIEFTFADTEIGENVKKTTMPIYTKMFN